MKDDLRTAVASAILNGAVETSTCKVTVGFDDQSVRDTKSQEQGSYDRNSPRRRSGRIKEKSGSKVEKEELIYIG